MKQNNPWFDDKCSNVFDQRKQDKLQWLQYSRQTNGDNLKNVRRETTRTFRKIEGKCERKSL
jgi:hypothetical protein